MFAGRAAASDSQHLPSGATAIQTTFKYIHTHIKLQYDYLIKKHWLCVPMQRLSAGLNFFLKLPVFDGIPWKDYILDREAHGPHRSSVGDESRAPRALFELQHCFFQEQGTNNLKQIKKGFSSQWEQIRSCVLT